MIEVAANEPKLSASSRCGVAFAQLDEGLDDGKPVEIVDDGAVSDLGMDKGQPPD